MNGTIDEVRISASARSGVWINTTYNNQVNATPRTGNFIKSLGDEEALPPTLRLGNVTDITKKWGRNFNLNHSITVTNATAENVKVTYNVSWITKCASGTLNKDSTGWCNQTRSNYTVQNVTVRVNANSTNISAINDSKTFWINITKRDIEIVANPEETQIVDPGETFWINGSAKDEHNDELIGKADLIREGSIVNTTDIASGIGNANFSRTEPSAGTFKFSIRFYNLTHYNNETTSNSTVTVTVSPNITSYAPPSPVNDTVCNFRTFYVTVNQTVNVSWYLNESFLFKNESITEANCTLHAEVAGEHNVSAIAANANGTDMQTWIWNVTEAPPPPSPRRPRGGGEPRDSDDDEVSDVDEMLAGTDWKDPCDPNPDCAACLALRPRNPTPTPKSTPTPVVAPTLPPVVTPTPTPTPTPTLEEPGFEAVFAIAGLLAVVYLVLRRKKRK
jgi:PGF-CTERM protein